MRKHDLVLAKTVERVGTCRNVLELMLHQIY